MIAHICRLSLRHKASIQANSYRLPYARSSYGSLTYLRQKLRRCPQLPLPRKKGLLQLCPDITGWFHQGTNTTTIDSGAPVDGKVFSYTPEIQSNGQAPIQNRDGRRCYFRANAASSLYGKSTSVSVAAAYCLMIIRA